MRFLQDGPSIPDELLTARDEGRVVFFCGAGVSRARAELPDFFGLADLVIQRLGVAADSPACKLLDVARSIDERTGVSGVISADRIFGLLERDFLSHDIEAAVAEALHPPEEVDLSAHRILLDLATTPEGHARIVTTNFDRLFEDCTDGLHVWQPGRLPDPARPNDMDGIVYLHGRATKDYSGAEGDGFVLSSSEFGRAYLSEGWATNFFREVIDRYVVVFVGYTADDPPVHYLLEALNKTAGQLEGAYAFQSGTSSEASARWHHKGIEAIAYPSDDEHSVLWKTLEAWSDRARAPEGWYKGIIALARKGPECLQPFERGQVAHVVSTLEGARKFTEDEPVPPAEWLCVFDPYRRYAKPGRIGGFDENGLYIDPFDLYGLDSDVEPKKIDPDSLYTKRDVPKGAWDGFAATRLDRKHPQDANFSALRGHWATNVPTLAPRIWQLGMWISKVADHPAAVWWAANQGGLHPDIQHKIQWELERSPSDTLSFMRKAWRYLFEAWEVKRDVFADDWYELKALIDRDGWDSATARKFAAINRPHLECKPRFRGGPKPPERDENIDLKDLFALDVEYPGPLDGLKVPDEWLAFVVREFRKTLEHALTLEHEIGGYGLINISPIVPDDEPDIDTHSRTHGLSGSVIRFASLFSRLIGNDASAAYQEFIAWPINDDTIFSRLRIWACGNSDLISVEDFAPRFLALSDDAFWNTYHQRDLLLVLASRWNSLPKDSKKPIEDRLLEGPPRWKSEPDAKFQKRRAWDAVNRITWMANNGCKFTFNRTKETKRLRATEAEWKPEYAASAARSMEARGGWIKTETDHSSLLAEPLSSTLSKALELSGRVKTSLIEKDPFAGLSEERPVRALAALTHAGRRDEYPEWAWHTFLNSKARKVDKSKLSALIAERICRAPDEAVMEFMHPASDWLLNISDTLGSRCLGSFDRIITKLIEVLNLQPTVGKSVLVRGHEKPDWAGESINAPVGKIAQALFKDPRTDGLKAGEGLRPEWIAYVTKLLSLPGDLRRWALVIFAHNLDWFYTIDPNWTKAELLPILEKGDEQDRDAMWNGILWSAKIPGRELYMRLKPQLLALAKKRTLARHGYDQVLAGMILAGWGTMDEKTGERCISNNEMRDIILRADDEFRSTILWQAERWSKAQEKDAKGKWDKLLIELLRDVWPRQKAAKTPTTSARLCGLAFSDAEHFPQMVKIILPLLIPVDHDRLFLPNLRKSKDDIVDLYPRDTLALLYSILPDNVDAWPYGIEEILSRMGEADDSLHTDERFLELNRKWNSR